MSAVGCMYYYMTCSLLLLHCNTYLAFGRFFLISWGQLNKDSFIAREAWFYHILCDVWVSYVLWKIPDLLRKCHCLRKCSRGQKLWSIDLAETWHRSWVWWDNYFKSHFGSLLWLLVLELQGGVGGGHFLPFEHWKSSFPAGILKVPQDPTGKLCSQLSLTMNSTIIELSVHACNFVVEVLHREEPGARV